MTLAKERLVTENIGLAHYIANRFQNTNVDPDDLFSIACMGLWKAAKTFDESKNVQFSTYSTKCMTNEIRMYLRQERKHPTILLDDIIYEDFDSNPLTYADMIGDPKSDFVSHILTNDEFQRVVSFTLNVLDQYDRIVTLYRFSGKLQSYISNVLGFSQSWVSKILKKSFTKIRNSINMNFKEIFSIKISEDFYSISFSRNDVPSFDHIYENLKKNRADYITSSALKVQHNKSRIILSVPANLKSFAYIAEFFQELDNSKWVH